MVKSLNDFLGKENPTVIMPSVEFGGFNDGEWFPPGASFSTVVRKTKNPPRAQTGENSSRVKGEGDTENIKKSLQIKESFFGPKKSQREIKTYQLKLKKEHELTGQSERVLTPANMEVSTKRRKFEKVLTLEKVEIITKTDKFEDKESVDDILKETMDEKIFHEIMDKENGISFIQMSLIFSDTMTKEVVTPEKVEIITKNDKSEEVVQPPNNYMMNPTHKMAKHIEPPSPQYVAATFVNQYYNMLKLAPNHLNG